MLVGSTAESIANLAHAQSCDGIVMGIDPPGNIARAVLGGAVSVKTSRLADTPATLVK